TSDGEEPERKLSKDSIRNVVAVVRAMLNEAVERKLIAANPATRLGKLYREAGSVREQVDPFTANEIPEWVFLSPGKIEWREGTGRGGRQPIGHAEGQPMDMKNFPQSRFSESLRQSSGSMPTPPGYAPHVCFNPSDEW